MPALDLYDHIAGAFKRLNLDVEQGPQSRHTNMTALAWVDGGVGMACPIIELARNLQLI